MFARVKKSGEYQYLQIVENRKEKGKVKQRVVATIGRLDQLQQKGRVETLIRSLSRFSEQAILIISGNSDIHADAKKIGPALIFERLWQQSGVQYAIKKILSGRKFDFDVERAIFLTVLHRLMVSGSDRSCDRWHRDYIIDGVEDIKLHHLYRAMSFLGEELSDQEDATPFSPRCNKDLVEELIFRGKGLQGCKVAFGDQTDFSSKGQDHSGPCILQLPGACSSKGTGTLSRSIRQHF
jgi:hypothetical protein